MSQSAEERRECSERWDDEIAAYLLDALSSEDAFAVRRHLDACERCRAQVRWLHPAVDLLPASVDQMTARPALRERIMAEVGEDARSAVSPGAAPSRLMRVLGLVSLRPVLVAVASISVIAAGVGGYLLAATGSDPETIAVESLAPRTDIGGELEVEGDRAVLTLTGLPLISRDEVYQTWLRPEEGGDVVPASAFVREGERRGHSVISEGIEDADRVMVTREPAYAGEPPAEPSTNPLAAVDLPD